MVCSQIEGKQSRTKTRPRECNGLEATGMGWSSDRPEDSCRVLEPDNVQGTHGPQKFALIFLGFMIQS